MSKFVGYFNGFYNGNTFNTFDVYTEPNLYTVYNLAKIHKSIFKKLFINRKFYLEIMKGINRMNLKK